MGVAVAASITGAPDLDARMEVPPTVVPISLLLSKASWTDDGLVIRLGPQGVDSQTVDAIVNSLPPDVISRFEKSVLVDDWWTWPDSGPTHEPVPMWWVSPPDVVVSFLPFRRFSVLTIFRIHRFSIISQM